MADFSHARFSLYTTATSSADVCASALRRAAGADDPMSDVGRYRQVYPRLWRHPGFIGLTKSARELSLYLLTGPQTNRIGLFHFSAATASEDLGVAVETIRKGLADVAVTFGWTFDARARVLYIPSWWKWNAPANANVLKGNLKDLNEIPSCGLVEAFALNTQTLPVTLLETFLEGCKQRLPKPSPIQEQEQEQEQDQEQEPALRATEAANGGRRAAAEQKVESLVPIAEETFKLTSPNADTEVLIDSFLSTYRHHKPQGQPPRRPAILEALHRARRGASRLSA